MSPQDIKKIKLEKETHSLCWLHYSRRFFTFHPFSWLDMQRMYRNRLSGGKTDRICLFTVWSSIVVLLAW